MNLYHLKTHILVTFIFFLVAHPIWGQDDQESTKGVFLIMRKLFPFPFRIWIYALVHFLLEDLYPLEDLDLLEDLEDGIQEVGVTEFPIENFDVSKDEVKVSKETETATEVPIKNKRRRKKKPRTENGVKRRKSK